MRARASKARAAAELAAENTESEVRAERAERAAADADLEAWKALDEDTDLLDVAGAMSGKRDDGGAPTR